VSPRLAFRNPPSGATGAGAGAGAAAEAEAEAACGTGGGGTSHFMTRSDLDRVKFTNPAQLHRVKINTHPAGQKLIFMRGVLPEVRYAS
jgi:hypothetical protein